MHLNHVKCARHYPLQKAHVVARIKQFQELWSIPISHIAREYDVDAQWLANTFRLKSMPDQQNMRRICKLLGVKPMELLGTACTQTECAEWHTNPEDR